jgi:hypothetical protein
MGRVRYAGRVKPYTTRGISRVPCCRCGAPSVHQWQVCANGRRFLGVCAACDYGINRIVMTFMRVPRSRSLLRRYARVCGLAP